MTDDPTAAAPRTLHTVWGSYVLKSELDAAEARIAALEGERVAETEQKLVYLRAWQKAEARIAELEWERDEARKACTRLLNALMAEIAESGKNAGDVIPNGVYPIVGLADRPEEG